MNRHIKTTSEEDSDRYKRNDKIEQNHDSHLIFFQLHFTLSVAYV